MGGARGNFSASPSLLSLLPGRQHQAVFFTALPARTPFFLNPMFSVLQLNTLLYARMPKLHI